jgi:hypothetical protein
MACRAPQVRFQSEANMNWQARLAGSVENDPERTWVKGKLALLL